MLPIMSFLLKNVKFATLSDKSKLFNAATRIRKDLMTTIAPKDSNTTDEVSDSVGDDSELDIEKLRDKSKLRKDHHNILFNKRPYDEPVRNHHLCVKYNRKLYGKYGSESGVYPGIMWPTKAAIEERKEYERVAYPHTIQEMIAIAETQLEIEENKKKEIHDKVIVNLTKLETWKKELHSKIAKKEAEALAVKEKKEKLIEEVRRHFGYTVDPRDERFKEMLVLKEKEQKKKDKQARMEEREKKAISKLMAKHEIDPKMNDS